jgi:hypothetical protein
MRGAVPCNRYDEPALMEFSRQRRADDGPERTIRPARELRFAGLVTPALLGPHADALEKAYLDLYEGRAAAS